MSCTNSYPHIKSAKLKPAGANKEYTTNCPMFGKFNENCRPITLEWLERQEQYDSDSDDQSDDDKAFDNAIANLDTITATNFLYVMLIDLTRPKSENKLEVTPFKRTPLAKKPRLQVMYRHKYTFASLNDPQLLTCVLLEKNNDQHHTNWLSNLGKLNVRVGMTLAIQNPRLIGRLPTQSLIIETKQPFIILTGPSLTPTPLLSHITSHNMKFFVLTGKSILFSRQHLPLPWKTTCNAEFCDRLHFTEKNTTTCGCWGSNSKNDSTSKNVVIQFDFKFTENGRRIKIRNFTSLRTSLSFMKNQRMPADFDVLSLGENISALQKKVLTAMKYINNNGGWTIVGWFIRGEKQIEDPKDDNEEDLLSDGEVKHNICYLYPTTQDVTKLPENCTFGPDDLYAPSQTKPTGPNSQNSGTPPASPHLNKQQTTTNPGKMSAPSQDSSELNSTHQKQLPSQTKETAHKPKKIRATQGRKSTKTPG